MKKSMISRALGMALIIGLTTPLSSFAYAQESAAVIPMNTPSTLEQLILWAVEHDAGQQQLQYQADAIIDLGMANSQLMDPKVKVGIGGLPVDTFSFDEDPMTSMSVGLMQQFGRGDTLSLMQKQSRQQADSLHEKAGVRQLDVTKTLTQAWIELAYLNQARQIMTQNQRLFQELAHYLGTNYGVGANQAQDLIQADVQLSRIDDQLQANQQMQDRLKAQLSEWVGHHAAQLNVYDYPQWLPLNHYLASEPTDFYSTLATHPAIMATDAVIRSAEIGIDIANEAYQPQFGVEVMYAHRQADRMDGSPAPDMLSAYLTLDIPLFTEKRQDKKLSAAQHQVGATKTQRDLLLKSMQANIRSLMIDRHNTQQRLSRYQQSLLKQAQEKTHAVERGYQNNTSQLDEYIRAASDELAIKLEQARLGADLHQANNNLAYLLNKY
ncbi:TolC family protein [Photobacterium japonica]|uniref:TolC family protein n=1 Tax=Photobacterium japonica TaxID=2910235 RepID=UPI003D1121B1